MQNDERLKRFGPSILKAVTSLTLGFVPGGAWVKAGLDLVTKPWEDASKKGADKLHAERLVKSTAENVSDQIAARFEKEGIYLDKTLDLAAETLDAAVGAPDGFFFESLAVNGQSPHLLPALWVDKRSKPLPDNLEALWTHDLLLTETGTALYPLLTQLPGFHNWLVGYVARQSRDFQGLSDLVKLLSDEGRHDAEFERKYLAAVVQEHNKVELFIEKPALDAESREQILTVAYVSLNLTRGRENRPTGAISADELFETLGTKTRCVLVAGKAGSGKTTLLRWAAVTATGRTITKDEVRRLTGKGGDICNDTQSYHTALQPTDLPADIPAGANWRTKVPLLLRLRNWETSFPPSVDAFHRDGIGTSGPVLDVPAGWAQRVVAAGRGLLLLDGLDELSPATREKAQGWIRNMARELNENNLLVVTSRPAAIEEGALGNAFEEYEVSNLSREGKIEFVKCWHNAVAMRLGEDAHRLGKLEEKRDHLLGTLDNSVSVAHLAENPLLCSLLCALNRLYRDSIPKNLYDLCDSACQMLLWDRDYLINLPPSVASEAYHGLSGPQRRWAAMALAYAIVNSNSSLITRETAIAQICIALSRRPGERDNDTIAIQVLTGILERSGLLRPVGESDFEFVHNTLRDFLAAELFAEWNECRTLVQKFSREGPQKWEPIVLFGSATKSRVGFGHGLLEELLKLAGSPAPEGATHARTRECQLAALKAVARMKFELPLELKEQMDRLRQDVLPVDTLEKAEAIAEGGESALEFLQWNDSMSEAQAAACLHGLSRIGTPKAQEAIRNILRCDHRAEVMEQALMSIPAAEVAEAVNLLLIPSVKASIREPMYATTYKSRIDRETFRPYISDLAPVATWDNVTTLDFSGTKVSDVGPLSKLIGLIELNLSGTKVSNIVALRELKELRVLNLSGTSVDDLGPLAEQEYLRGLNLSATNVSDIGPLAKIHGLGKLNLSNTSVANVSPLAQLQRLRELDLSRTKVAEAGPLAQLQRLRVLNLSGTHITDVEPLAELRVLETLDLSGTKVTDIGPLRRVHGLTELNLSRTRVTDIDSLGNISRLRMLDISGLPVSDEQRAKYEYLKPSKWRRNY